MNLSDHNPTVACFQETMHGQQSLIAPRNYTIEHNNPQEAFPGQGLAILTKKDVPSSRIHLNTNIQALAIIVSLPYQLTICNFYVSPNSHLTSAEMRNLISQLSPPFLLMGDLNCHHPILGSNHTNDRGVLLESLLTTNDVCLLNDGSGTRLNISTGDMSSPDVTLCSPDIVTRLLWRVSQEKFNSDHFAVIVRDSILMRIPTVKRFSLRRANWTLFRRLTHFADAPEDNVETMLNYFETSVNSAALESIPHTFGGLSRVPVPWWNESCRATRIEKKRAQRRFHRAPSPANRAALNQARANARRVQRQARKQCWTNFLSTITASTPLNEVFNRIKKIQGRYKPRSLPILESNHGTIIDSYRVANALAENFSRISSSRNYPMPFNTQRIQIERRRITFTTDSTESYNVLFSLAELKTALKETKNSACGDDGIYYQMIKHLPDSALYYLLRVYNKCWSDGCFPDRWRRAVLLPFLKPDKPPTEANSYRPIALTSCVCKLIEKMANARLMYFLESNSLLNELQYGFRRDRGTEDVIGTLETAICTALARKKVLYAVFFDMEKAYDTAWKYGILNTLEQYGVRGNLGLFIANFLSGRQFRVKGGNGLFGHFPPRTRSTPRQCSQLHPFLIIHERCNQQLARESQCHCPC